MASTAFSCPHCLAKYDRPELIGKKLRCKNCGQVFVAGEKHEEATSGRSSRRIVKPQGRPKTVGPHQSGAYRKKDSPHNPGSQKSPAVVIPKT
jgi:DNA-directed RNA polymerase subunit RPC12/RpoP